jgi:hypothetical protein
MKVQRLLISGALAIALIGSAQLLLAETPDTAITAHKMNVPKEEYELRLLEEQIQVLRDKLLMHGGKLDAKASAEWHKKYDNLRATLNNWNDSIDGIH